MKFQGDDPTPVQVFHTGNYSGFRILVWHDLRRHCTVALMDNRCHPLDEMAAKLYPNCQPGLEAIQRLQSRLKKTGLKDYFLGR